MELGIFAKTFVQPTFELVLNSVRSCGLSCIQLNLAAAGLPSMPDSLPLEQAGQIGGALRKQGIHAAAVSGTFNMIHPDPAKRELGLRRLAVLAGACREVGTSIITLCTGTRDPDDMWRHHPDNALPEAWRDLLQTMEAALEIAEQSDVSLAFEPEVSNVVDSARKGRLLLDELQSPRLKVIMDGANLFPAGQLPRMSEILDEAFDLLGEDIVIAHAKDLDRDGEAGQLPAGKGLLDYDRYIRLLRQSGFRGPLVLHGLAEADVPASLAFLRAKLSADC